MSAANPIMTDTTTIAKASGGDLSNNNDKDKGKKRLSIRKEAAKAYKRTGSV